MGMPTWTQTLGLSGAFGGKFATATVATVARHCTPIRERREIVVAALTLYDARVIHEADTKLRI